MSMRIIVVTEEPQGGIRDYAPKNFTGKRQIMTVLGILTDAMAKIIKDGETRALQYAGRDVISVTLTQEKD